MASQGGRLWGSRKRRLLCLSAQGALIVALALIVPGLAWGGGGTLYDQYDNPGTVSAGSQNFEAALDSYDAELADDFVVPSGESWTIGGVDVAGAYFGGPGPAASVNVNFYANSLDESAAPDQVGRRVGENRERGADGRGTALFSGLHLEKCCETL